MKKFLKRLLLGFCFSTVVATCVYLRGAAIQGMPPIKVAEDPKGQIMSKDDFVNDVMRIRDEVYDPVRPVSAEGSFMLKLEKAAYAAPGVLFASALSPSFLPAFAYSEQLRQDHRRRLPLGASLPQSVGAAAQAEGLAWGVAQGIVFYLPFFIGRRRKAQGGDSCPIESEPTQQCADERPEVRERSVLDSAIDRCDEQNR
jgi:hypothetical protein